MIIIDVGTLMHLSMASPTHPPPGWMGKQWGFDRLSCPEPLPWGVTRCQYTYLLPWIDRGFDIIGLYYANNSCQFHLPSGGNSCQLLVNSPVQHGGGVVGGIIDRCIRKRNKCFRLWSSLVPRLSQGERQPGNNCVRMRQLVNKTW